VTSHLTNRSALWLNNYDIYGQVSFGYHGGRVNKVNNARRIFEQLSPWLFRCWHPTTPTTARWPRSICFP